MGEAWDVVVVGSGLGGLTAGACLAAAGRRVLVLERHDLAGGNATVFRRHHEGVEYEFDVGVHYIGDCGPGGLISSIYASLGVGDRMVFRPLDPDGFDTLLYPGGIELRVPADWDRYRDRLVEALPNDRAGIERCVGVLHTVAEESRARSIPGAETPTFDEWSMRSLDQLFAECELSSAAVALLDHWSGLYAGPPSSSTVAMHAQIIDHYMRGAYYPEGGGQMLPARLVQVIEAFGGEVRTLASVDEIIVDGQVTGVRLADGSVVDAPLVISNADHIRTVRHLVAREHWDPGTLAFVDHAVMTIGLVCVYVVVDVDLTDRPNTNYHVWPTTDIEGVYTSLDKGEFGEGDPFLYLAFASVKDPDNPHLCPPGYTNFQIMTFAPRGDEAWGVATSPADGGRYRRLPEYRAAKDALTDRMIAAAEKLLGPFRDHIVHLETATPITHERYVASTGGTSYGYLHSPGQSGPNRPAHRTEIGGLWVTGANTVSGHGIAGAMVGGVQCAGEILDRPGLLVEMILGTALADPGAIPTDPPGFDPVEWSRGEQLRTRRARSSATRATDSPAGVR